MSEGDFDMRKECYENLADLCGVPGYLLEFQVRPFFQRQIDFIQESGIVTAMVGLLNAPPGTRLHERMREEGRLIDAMSGDNVDGTTNFMPRMGLDVLRKGHRNLMRHIYAPEHYYKRAMTFLREYQKTRVGIPMDFQCLLAVLRSTIRLGIFGEERFQYWKILFWTLFCRPQFLTLTISLAIYGHHFRKISNRKITP